MKSALVSKLAVPLGSKFSPGVLPPSPNVPFPLTVNQR